MPTPPFPARRPRAALAAGLLGLALLAACGRPLAEGERAFLATLHGDSLEVERVAVNDRLSFMAPVSYPVRPRVTCRSRIFPPPSGPRITGTPGAMVVFNTILLRPDLYADDLLPGYPDRLDLAAAMLLAHEATHVWQWQNRALTGYHPLRAAAEHATQADPYLFDPETEAAFLDHGFEQQASLVEEYVCCRALAPEAARTGRLHALLAEVMALPPLPASRHPDVRLPWPDADLGGICD